MQAIYSDLGTRGSIPLYKVFKLLPVRLVGCAGAQANGKPSTNEAPRVGSASVDNPTVRGSNHEQIFLAAAESFDKPIRDKSSVSKFQSRTMVQNGRDELVYRGLHSLVEEFADQSLLWQIILDSSVADAYFDPCHSSILGGAQPLFENTYSAFRTKDVIDPAADHKGSVSSGQINHLIVYFDRE